MDINSIIKAQKCGDIFTNDPDKAKEEYRKLAKQYHPDANKEELAAEAFQKINEMYTKATSLFEKGIWEASNKITFIDKLDGKAKTINFLKEYSFELGMQYISSTKMTYVLEEKNKKYYNNFLGRVANLKYDSPEMKNEFSKYFPQLVANFETTDGKFVIVMEKTRDVFKLQDILEYYNGNIPDRHVAWIMSRLCNISCYLQHTGLSHNGVSIDNCFISPEFHSVLVLGGWWYCVNEGEKMVGTQKQIYDIMSPVAKSNKVGSITTDLESIKLIGRTLLGSTKAPKAFEDWLNSGSSSKATKEYTKWDKALTGAYGARKFVEMKVGEKEVYKL